MHKMTRTFVARSSSKAIHLGSLALILHALLLYMGSSCSEVA